MRAIILATVIGLFAYVSSAVPVLDVQWEQYDLYAKLTLTPSDPDEGLNEPTLYYINGNFFGIEDWDAPNGVVLEHPLIREWVYPSTGLPPFVPGVYQPSAHVNGHYVLGPTFTVLPYDDPGLPKIDLATVPDGGATAALLLVGVGALHLTRRVIGRTGTIQR